MQDDLNMIPSTVTASEEKIFIYEHLFNPFQDRVLVMDKETRSVEVFVLEFPVEIYGEKAGLNSLDWDTGKENLVGIVKDEMDYNNSSLMGEMEAYKLNLSNNEYEALPEVGRLSGRNFVRKSFYNKKLNEFAELVFKDRKNQLLQYNHQENVSNLLELKGAHDFDTSIIIIDYGNMV